MFDKIFTTILICVLLYSAYYMLRFCFDKEFQIREDQKLEQQIKDLAKFDESIKKSNELKKKVVITKPKQEVVAISSNSDAEDLASMAAILFVANMD